MNIQQKLGNVKKYIYYNFTDRTELPFYPNRLYLELTNKCNFQCIMCPNGKGLMQREKGFMDYELAKKIIDEMGPHVNTIVLHIWGESLLHPRIFDIINYCHRYNVKTELSTNTSLLNKDIIKNIIGSGLDKIYLCVDGITKDTYERVRKNGDFDITIKNVEDFINMKNKIGNKPLVNLQIIVMKETSNEIEEFKKRWSIQGVNNINVKTLDTWGGQISEISSLDINNNIKKDIPVKRFHCPNIWYHVHIYWNGDVVCCDRDFDAKNPLGNVKDGVMKVWNGDKMQELRRKHFDTNLGDIPSCDNCNEWYWWRPGLFSSWGNIPKER